MSNNPLEKLYRSKSFFLPLPSTGRYYDSGINLSVDNEIGVIGVGHEIDLYAVKVLGRNGSGYLSDIIEGLDWCIDNGMQVINMSLGTDYYVESFEEAIERVNEAGIVQVASAGNDGPGDNTVDYPAKFSEVIAVSATDDNDNIIVL